MKTPLIILITFLVAMATSFLLDVPIIHASLVRQILVILLIVVEIIAGSIIVIFTIKQSLNKKV